MEMSCREQMQKMGCSGADPLNYFNLRPTPRIAVVAPNGDNLFWPEIITLPTIPAPAIWRYGFKNISWYVISFQWKGEILIFQSSPVVGTGAVVGTAN